MDRNFITVTGNVTKDKDEKSFGYFGEIARINFSLAVKRSRKQNNEWVDDVSYFDVQMWGKQAENLANVIKKGMRLTVSGYLKQDRWEKDGKNFSKIYIVGEDVEQSAFIRKEQSQANQTGGGFQPSGNAGGFEENIPWEN